MASQKHSGGRAKCHFERAAPGSVSKTLEAPCATTTCSHFSSESLISTTPRHLNVN